MTVITPSTASEVAQAVRDAESSGTTLRARGGSWSLSDVAYTDGITVDTARLDAITPIERSQLRDPAQWPRLICVGAGIRMHVLNRLLAHRGLAIENMGSHSGQSLAGTIQTSSHGTGIGFGTVSDLVRSIRVVAAGGRQLQIEPSLGITDPGQFTDADITLIQDDDWFYSAVVCMGSMGVVTSVTLSVVPLFYLTETRVVRSWDTVRDELMDGALYRDHRHCNVLINPYKRRGRHLCNVATRNVTGTVSRLQQWIPRQNMVPTVVSVSGMARGVVAAMNKRPQTVVPLVQSAILRTMARKRSRQISHRILDNGPLNLAHPVYALEVSVSAEDTLDALDRVLAVAKTRARQGGFLTAPISVRWTGASKHYLSPQYGRESCIIELISLHDTISGRDELRHYQEALLDFGGRQHWGLDLYGFDGTDTRIRTDYPQFARWKTVLDDLNHSGVFDSPFTQRCGLAERRTASAPRSHHQSGG